MTILKNFQQSYVFCLISIVFLVFFSIKITPSGIQTSSYQSLVLIFVQKKCPQVRIGILLGTIIEMKLKFGGGLGG